MEPHLGGVQSHDARYIATDKQEGAGDSPVKMAGSGGAVHRWRPADGGAQPFVSHIPPTILAINLWSHHDKKK